MTDSKGKGGCGRMKVVFGLLCMLFCALLIASYFVPVYGAVGDKAVQTATASNCRQIIIALKLYAEDHSGKYPDADASGPTTANQAFRLLIREDYIEDERIFGTKWSKFNPDNIIGDAPDFPKALEVGENHWAMTRGVTDSSGALTPLVFENPISKTWPPTWNVDAAGKKERGRAWREGKIIVGLNDSSVMPIGLEAAKGTSVGPKAAADGKNAFTRAGMNFEVLDIEE